MDLGVLTTFIRLAIEEERTTTSKYQFQELSKLYSLVAMLIRSCDVSKYMKSSDEDVNTLFIVIMINSQPIFMVVVGSLNSFTLPISLLQFIFRSDIIIALLYLAHISISVFHLIYFFTFYFFIIFYYLSYK